MNWDDLTKRGFETMTPKKPNSYVLSGDDLSNTVHANHHPETGMREINSKRGRKFTVIVLNATDDVVGIGHGTNHDDARTAAHR